MRVAGIDVGSRYVKYALIEHGRPSFFREETGYDPLIVCRKFMDETSPDRIVATGYGRHLLEADRGIGTITEIRAVGRGAREVFPSCRTIIDIGGQDTKAVLLKTDGAVENFEMNDRCAAGTGRFIEIMAHALGYSIDEFGLHCATDQQVTITSQCTVFAESEVITLIGRGVGREKIAAALHNSIVTRTLSLVKRVGLAEDIVFAGGCARDPCLRRMLEERLGKTVLVHREPDMLAAYGAALSAIGQ